MVKSLLLVALLGTAAAGVLAAPPIDAPLADYVGRYADRLSPIEVVAGESLLAVIDEAKYRLRRTGVDAFTADSGDTLVFHRNSHGAVVDFELRGNVHIRQSASVSTAAANMARPRPPGADTAERYRYRTPLNRHDGIPVGDIARSDLGSDIATRLVRGVLDGSWQNVDSILLYQRGHLVLEEYFYGYDQARAHQLRSATKSIVSALAGAAIDRGALPGVDEPVLAHLAYTTYANPDPRKARLTLGNLLTMRPGLACDDHDPKSPGSELVIDDTADWVKATLDLPLISDPGTEAHYCSGAVAVVGRLVETAVHRPLPVFAQQALFAPLGIRRANWRWNYTLTNVNKEYAQIHLRPRDMLKIGLLYAQHGQWRGQQVLSAAWVQASLAPQAELEDTGYGYFWWRPWLHVDTPEGALQVTFNAAQGNGGQKIYIVPQYELVAVFTGGDYNSGGSPPNKIMAQVILPRLIEAYRAPPATIEPAAEH